MSKKIREEQIETVPVIANSEMLGAIEPQYINKYIACSMYIDISNDYIEATNKNKELSIRMLFKNPITDKECSELRETKVFINMPHYEVVQVLCEKNVRHETKVMIDKFFNLLNNIESDAKKSFLNGVHWDQVLFLDMKAINTKVDVNGNTVGNIDKYQILRYALEAKEGGGFQKTELMCSLGENSYLRIRYAPLKDSLLMGCTWGTYSPEKTKAIKVLDMDADGNMYEMTRSPADEDNQTSIHFSTLLSEFAKCEVTNVDITTTQDAIDIHKEFVKHITDVDVFLLNMVSPGLFKTNIAGMDLIPLLITCNHDWTKRLYGVLSRRELTRVISKYNSVHIENDMITCDIREGTTIEASTACMLPGIDSFMVSNEKVHIDKQECGTLSQLGKQKIIAGLIINGVTIKTITQTHFDNIVDILQCDWVVFGQA